MTELGLWQMVGHQSPIDKATGIQNLLKGAKLNNSDAMSLLATAHARGDGVPRSFDKAVQFLIKAAKLGHPKALRQLGFLLKPIPRFDAMRDSLYYLAAKRGDVYACYALGLSLLDSKDEDQQAYGRGWLRTASDAGSYPAQLVLSEMTGLPLKNPASIDVIKIPWASLSRYMDVPTKSRAKLSFERMSDSPKLEVYRNFITPEFADYMIIAGSSYLERATVNDSVEGQIEDQTRTNSFANFYLLESDVVIEAVNHRLLEVAGADLYGDPLSLLCYHPGESYAPHYDFFDPDFPEHRPALQAEGQRTKTMLIYLNSAYGAGETVFPDAGISFKGDIGDLLVFENTMKDGSPDRATLHTGTAPTDGIKWITSKWIRSKARP
jgi:prolyl 4-hydroxylase